MISNWARSCWRGPWQRSRTLEPKFAARTARRAEPISHAHRRAFIDGATSRRIDHCRLRHVRTLWLGFVVDNGYAAALPAKTPRAIVARLNAEIVRALKHPAVEQRLRANGSEAIGNSVQEMTGVVKNDLQKWRKIVTEAGIRPDS